MKIVVTGATGFLGRRLVRKIAEQGQTVTCIVRGSSNTQPLKEFVGEEFINQLQFETAELTDVERCQEILQDADVVYHVAAALGGSTSVLFLHTVVPTRTFVAASVAANVKRFVLISSLGVYGNDKLKRKAILDETCPVDLFPEKRDPYTFSKIVQEQVAWEAHEEHNLPLVVIRPGVITGYERGIMSNRVGLKFGGILLRMGGRQELPYVHVDNCAEGIMRAGIVPDIEGQVFNLLDDHRPRGKDVVKQLRKAGHKIRQVIIPEFFIGTFAGIYDWYSRWSEGQLPGVINRYRSSAAWKSLKYSNQKAKDKLFWIPRFKESQTKQGPVISAEPAPHKIEWNLETRDSQTQRIQTKEAITS